MIEGILELIVVESRGVVCHLWNRNEPLYDTIDIDEGYAGPPLPHETEDWCIYLVTGEPPFVGVKEPREKPEEACWYQTILGLWHFFGAFDACWIRERDPEWQEIQRSIHLELDRRHDSLDTKDGRQDAQAAIAQIVSELPRLPHGRTRRSNWYLVTTGPPDYAPVILGDDQSELSLGVQSLAMIFTSALAKSVHPGDLLGWVAETGCVQARVGEYWVTLAPAMGHVLALSIETPYGGLPFDELERSDVLQQAEDVLMARPLGVESFGGLAAESPHQFGLRPIVNTYAVVPAEGEVSHDYVERARYWSASRYCEHEQDGDDVYLWFSGHHGMEWASGEPEELWLVGPSSDSWAPGSRVFYPFVDSRVLLGTQRWLAEEIAELESRANAAIRDLDAGRRDVARRRGGLDKLNAVILALCRLLPLLDKRVEFARSLRSAVESGEAWARIVWWEQHVPGDDTDILDLCQTARSSTNAIAERAERAAQTGARSLMIPAGIAWHGRAWEFDNFCDMQDISPEEAGDYVPLNLLEDEIKGALCEILGEPWDYSHWPGERADLLTNYARLDDREITAAFLLKGRGTRGTLHISGLGTRGDQVMRLTRIDCEAYVIVHVGSIDTRVFEHLKSQAEESARRQGRDILYCCVDGSELARILLSHGFALDCTSGADNEANPTSGRS